MSAYLVVQAKVHDGDRFKIYLSQVPELIAKYGGKYLARGGQRVQLEGQDQDQRWVVIEFPTMEKAQQWYHSEAYQRLKALRMDAAEGTLVLLEGV